jgi:hypothetical protein
MNRKKPVPLPRYKKMKIPQEIDTVYENLSEGNTTFSSTVYCTVGGDKCREEDVKQTESNCERSSENTFIPVQELNENLMHNDVYANCEIISNVNDEVNIDCENQTNTLNRRKSELERMLSVKSQNNFLDKSKKIIRKNTVLSQFYVDIDVDNVRYDIPRNVVTTVLEKRSDDVKNEIVNMRHSFSKNDPEVTIAKRTSKCEQEHFNNNNQNKNRCVHCDSGDKMYSSFININIGQCSNNSLDDDNNENGNVQERLCIQNDTVRLSGNECFKPADDRITPNLKSHSEISEKRALRELIETEEIYILHLRLIVEGYLPYLQSRTPKFLQEKLAYVFGNIKNIFEEAQIFYLSLKEDIESVDKVAHLFIESVNYLDLYSEYSRNKPTSDECFKEFYQTIIKGIENELSDKLGLASHLMCPIQRLAKYSLLMESIQKEVEKSGKSVNGIVSARCMIKKVMQKSNDLIAIDSITDCEVDLSKQGSFIMRGLFNVIKPRKFQCMVFLFEDMIVFTERIFKSMEQFQYVDSIKMANLNLRDSDDKCSVFYLRDYSKIRKHDDDTRTYVLETDNLKVKYDWVKFLEKKLWSQLLNVKENQNKNVHDSGHHLLNEVGSITTLRRKNFTKSTVTI